MTLSSPSKTSSSLAHFRKAVPTSIYSISKHLEDIYSVLGLLGLGCAQNESHPLPALVKPKSAERGTCAHKCQVLSADLSYCHCVITRLVRAQSQGCTGVPWWKSLLLSTPRLVLLFCFAILLFLTSGLCLFTATLPGVGSFSEPVKSRCFP